MNRSTLILVIVLIVLAAIGLSFYNRDTLLQKSPTASSTAVAPASDSPDAIEQDLESVDTGADLDADIRAADEDIESL